MDYNGLLNGRIINYKKTINGGTEIRLVDKINNEEVLKETT